MSKIDQVIKQFKKKFIIESKSGFNYFKSDNAQQEAVLVARIEKFLVQELESAHKQGYEDGKHYVKNNLIKAFQEGRK